MLKITRKTAATLRLAVIAAVCAVAVAACGSSGSGSSNNSSGSSGSTSGSGSSGLSLVGLANTKPDASAQHMGGTLNIISNEGWEHLDPATSYFQIDYLIVLRGIMRICAYDDNEGSPSRGNLDEIIASDEKLRLVRVPGHYWHGTKTLGSEPSMTLYFVTQLYDAKNPDEERRRWNDPAIIDPKTTNPFDWNKSN